LLNAIGKIADEKKSEHPKLPIAALASFKVA
jgi:hypothetical protein